MVLKTYNQPNQPNQLSIMNSMNRFTTSEKKLCGVCKKAGKSEKEYTSHFIKSVAGPNGIVVCPTILQNRCFKCNQMGHFSDHCKNATISKNRKMQEPIVSSTKIVGKKQEPTYDDMFPPLTNDNITGKKRDRNNGFTELRNIDTEKEIVPKSTMNFKKAIDTVIIHKEPAFPHKMTVLNGTKEEPKQTVINNHLYDNYVGEEEWEEWEQEYEIDYDEIDRRLEERDNQFYEKVKALDAWD